MSMQILDQKEKNYYYAPGIATYGIDGRPGKAGEDGAGIFFTTYLFDTDQNDLKSILSAIVNSKSLVETTKELTLSRKYKDGDYIITKTGKLYQLNNFSLIDLSKFESSVLLNDDEYKNYFNLIGIIDLTPQQEIERDVDGEKVKNVPFVINGNGRITFSNIDANNTISGLDLSNTLLDDSGDNSSNAILRIINSENSDGKYEMITLSVRPNSVDANEESSLNIFYDANNQFWNISSNYQIALDAPSVIVKQEDTAENSIYNKVLTNSDETGGIFSLEALCSISKSELKKEKDEKEKNVLKLYMNGIKNTIMDLFAENLLENSYFKIEAYKINSYTPDVYFFPLTDCGFNVNETTDGTETNIVCTTTIYTDDLDTSRIYAYLVANSEILISKGIEN